MAEHTPTPWEVGSHNRRGILKDAAGIADGCDAYMVAVTSAHSLVSPDEAAANAAFIVKAVNNHEAMLDVLKDAALQLEYMQEKTPTGTSAAVLARINHLLAVVGGTGQ